ncbi:MAG: Maf family protein, partial [Alphaproteobacteria bacterium]|nr:Maf family protein [Alphaproteobacteria bacterium]
AARRRLLVCAGLDIEVVVPKVDESQLKKNLLGSKSVRPVELAMDLARAKALSIVTGASAMPVLGADQILVTHDNKMLDKAGSLDVLAHQLYALSGKTHTLISAAAIIVRGDCVAAFAGTAIMTMRQFSNEFVRDYLQRGGTELLSCVGGYAIEGLGATLFERVEGDPFVIQGLPLLDILGWVHDRQQNDG